MVFSHWLLTGRTLELNLLVCYWVLDEVLRKMLKRIGSDVTHVGSMVLLNKTHLRYLVSLFGLKRSGPVRDGSGWKMVLC